jgi:hypothetical protein
MVFLDVAISPLDFAAPVATVVIVVAAIVIGIVHLVRCIRRKK